MVGENCKMGDSNHYEVIISCIIEDDSVATSNQGRSSIGCDGLFNNTYCGVTVSLYSRCYPYIMQYSYNSLVGLYISHSKDVVNS